MKASLSVSLIATGAGCVDSLGLDNKVAMCGEISRELDYVTDTNTALITFKIGRDHQAHCHSGLLTVSATTLESVQSLMMILRPGVTVT